MGIDVLLWGLGGLATLIAILSGALWKITREEKKEHGELIRQKADNDQVTNLEARLTSELASVRDGNEKLINKLEARHDKEIEQLASRLGESIRNSETNILTQIRLMIDVLKAKP